jgi:transcriptional regulator with XRE-family HTH domain
MDHMDRAELAEFLRRRRGRVQPADAGLEAGGRRRVPGLRRQEVAQLAGMSVDYYVRLEQGRGPRPSRQMLAAISRALRLSDDERAYLYHLAGEVPGPPPGPPRDVRPGVLHLLDRLDDTPAMVCDASYDVLAWNPMAAALLGDFSALPPGERNLIWRFFTDSRSRRRHDAGGVAAFARESVADLRAAAARYPGDARVRRLVERLRAASDEFAGLWAEQDVAVRRSARKRVRHPAVGWLDLDCESLHDPDRDQWIVLYTAAPGTPSHDALRLLKVLGTQALGTDPAVAGEAGEAAETGTAEAPRPQAGAAQADPASGSDRASLPGYEPNP